MLYISYILYVYTYVYTYICFKYLHCFPMCISQPIFFLLGSFLVVSNTLGVMGLCPSKSPWPQTLEGLAWECYQPPGEQWSWQTLVGWVIKGEWLGSVEQFFSKTTGWLFDVGDDILPSYNFWDYFRTAMSHRDSGFRHEPIRSSRFWSCQWGFDHWSKLTTFAVRR